MPHNPILKTAKIGVMDKLDVDMHTQIVLYKNNIFSEVLTPGSNLPMLKRLGGNWVGHWINTAPNNTSWRVNLPAKNEPDVFPTVIHLKYRVQDGQKMVEDKVKDTEILVSRALEASLRKITRNYALNHHRDAEEELENQISPGLFTELGLELMSVDVEMKLSDQDLERVRQLNDLDRAKRFPQQAEHEDELRTRDPAYTFRTRVIFNYKVLDASRLPTATLEETERWLWQRVRATLRREARKFEVNQVQEADQAMKDALDNETFIDHGMEILSTEIEIDLDERALSHARELDDLIADGRLKEKERELRSKAQEFYTRVMQMERFGLIVDLLAREKMDPKEVINYLDQKQKENFAQKLHFLQEADERDVAPDHAYADITEKILDGISTPDAGIRIYSTSPAALERAEVKQALPEPEDQTGSHEEIQAEAMENASTLDDEPEPSSDEDVPDFLIEEEPEG